MTPPLPRSEFAVTRRYVYLNHAAAGVLPLSSVVAIESFVREHADAGVLGTYPYDAALPEYRDKIGRFIGASGNEIVLIPNTSWGASTLALGIDFAPGDEVLVGDNEFPANVIPWIALRRRGVRVRLLEMQHERLTPDVLRREISPHTRVVTVSWVAYADGYRHDLAGLAEVAHRANALLCVDGMQGAGVLPIDVRAAGVDAFYAGAAKWMLGLHGVGFLYVCKQLADRLQLVMPGWRSMADMWDFHNYEQSFSRDAMRFEGGTPNLVGTLSLASSIDLFERAGPATIAGHVIALTDHFCDGLRRIGAELSTQRGEDVSSGIVTFGLPEHDSIVLGQALQKEGIITTYRAGGVRISPHGYNTADEIDFTLNVLERQIPTATRV